jgi:hypothetical protein
VAIRTSIAGSSLAHVFFVSGKNLTGAYNTLEDLARTFMEVNISVSAEICQAA